jgi:hypothetical protein
MTKKWLGTPPTKCDICQAPITTEFFDARADGGRWGNFCKACFKEHTIGKLGVGFGQHYKNASGVWEKQL